MREWCGRNPVLSVVQDFVRTPFTLDEILPKEQQAEEAAEEVLKQIDLIKKAIRTRAFRGELVANALQGG